MKRIATCLTILFFASGHSISAQDAKDKQPIRTAAELKGTYQVQFLKDAGSPLSITNDLLQKIEQKRDQNVVTYLSVSPNCRIMILPKQKEADPKMEEYVLLDTFHTNN